VEQTVDDDRELRKLAHSSRRDEPDAGDYDMDCHCKLTTIGPIANP